MTESITFKTEIGKVWWATVILLILTCSIIVFAVNKSIVALTFAIGFSICCLVLVAVAYYTKYTFEKDRLVIRCPGSVYQPIIPYSEVRKIILKKEWVMVVGCSTKCVAIHFKSRDTVNISPRNREEFVRILMERCPQATFEPKVKT